MILFINFLSCDFVFNVYVMNKFRYIYVFKFTILDFFFISLASLV